MRQPISEELLANTDELEIRARDLKVGDRLFDTWYRRPGTSVVEKVESTRKNIVVKIVGEKDRTSFFPEMKLRINRARTATAEVEVPEPVEMKKAPAKPRAPRKKKEKHEDTGS